jgi:hypothetical protein
MKEHLVDPQTGWAATRERVVFTHAGAAVIEETVTDPLTGQVYRGCRVASYWRPIGEWIRQIQEAEAFMTETERGRTRR